MSWTRRERDTLADLGTAVFCLMATAWMASSVPVRATEGAADSWTARLSEAQRVPVNTAGVNELRRLPGVGSVLAQRLVAERERNGYFHNLNDLERVPGIGPAKRRALEAYVSVP